MPKRRWVWNGLGLAGSMVAAAAYVWLRVAYLNRQGKPIFWLKELYAPAAVLSILLVLFAEKIKGRTSNSAVPRRSRRT